MTVSVGLGCGKMVYHAEDEDAYNAIQDPACDIIIIIIIGGAAAWAAATHWQQRPSDA